MNQTFFRDSIPRVRNLSHDDKLGVTVGEYLPGSLSVAADTPETLFRKKLVDDIYR